MRSGEFVVLDEKEQEYAEIIREAGFRTGESRVLVGLAVNGESSLRDLERVTQVKISTVCTAVSMLERMGVVKRRRLPAGSGRSLLLVSLAGDLVTLVEEHGRQSAFKKLSVCSKAAAKSRDFVKRPMIRDAGKARSQLSTGGMIHG